MKAKILLSGFLIGLLILFSGAAAAQGPDDDCPKKILVALARAGAACQRMEHLQVCYGYGAVTATFQPGSDQTLDAPGSLAGIAALRSLRVTESESGDWGIATLEIQANLVDVEQRFVTLLLFGDAEIANRVPYIPEIMIAATGTLYVRETPEPDSEIITRMGLRETAMANGRTENGDWLRILIPGTQQLAWVAREVLTSPQDINQLNIVDDTTPFYRPFQIFDLRSGANDAPCEGAPESGLLIQTPNTFTEVELVINGVTFRLAATAFVQASEGVLIVDTLDGYVEVEAQSSTQYIPAGSQARIPLDAEGSASGPPEPARPYAQERLAVLPLNNLPYRFNLPVALSADEIETLVAAFYAPPPSPVPPDDEMNANRCVRKVLQEASLWAGPGMFYEVIKPIPYGTRVYPVYQVMDAEGDLWWQLNNNNWIRADAVTSTGECTDVPVLDTIVPPANNTLVLETCETTNGPLRVDQQVTLEFVPPAFETIYEAQEAMRVDPGRVTVSERPLRVRASNPIQIADERYIRVFRATWTAEAGTYRLVGERLSYIVTCDITIPLGR
jgi:hypothetical protein